jgi:membrane protein
MTTPEHPAQAIPPHPACDVSPTALSARGWANVFSRAWRRTGEDNLSLIAGGLTYFILLALFPALAVLVSLYGLFADPAAVTQQMHALASAIPGGAQQVIGDELHQLTSAPHGALGFGVVFGLLVAMWSASRAAGGLILALNIAYDTEEKRGVIARNLLALGITLGLIVIAIIAVGLVAGAPAAIAILGLGGATKWLILILEWPLLLVIMIGVLATLYRFAPDRRTPRWRWISPGAAVATVLWIAVSIAFTIYVANFGSYNRTYGSLGALIGMLTWIYLSAYVVLFGAEINAAAERQGARVKA